MRILFVHNNFPGQYARIVKHLRGQDGVEILCGSHKANRQQTFVKRIDYTPHRAHGEKTHFALRYTEEAVIQGQSVYQAFLPIRNRWWAPDIILAHSGYGDGLFLKDLWPDAKILAYIEWYYNLRGSDIDFLSPESISDPHVQLSVRLKNTALLHDLAAMDWGQCPTPFQRSQIPEIFQSKISLLHDGIDTSFFSPDQTKSFFVGEREFRAGDPVISYISRGMEPMRGLPQFIEAVSILQKMRPEAHVVIIGEDKVAYSRRRLDGKPYLEWALKEFSIDLARVHVLGSQPLQVLRDVLRISAGHVYLTAPFVLSWSMMEAMSTGALVIASDTDPVRDIVVDGENGLLVPFYDAQSLANRMCEAVDDPGKFQPIRRRARATIVEKYNVIALTERYFRLITEVATNSEVTI